MDFSMIGVVASAHYVVIEAERRRAAIPLLMVR
jgi:hypothetical protein